MSARVCVCVHSCVCVRVRACACVHPSGRVGAGAGPGRVPGTVHEAGGAETPSPLVRECGAGTGSGLAASSADTGPHNRGKTSRQVPDLGEAEEGASGSFRPPGRGR